MFKARLAVLLALMLVGCEGVPDIIFEPQLPDVIITNECPCVEGSGAHDVYITEEVYVSETVYITEEDTTPDVIQEFYGDAASLPVLLWTEIGEPPMPKKLTDLTAATVLNDADQFLIEQGGTSKRITASVVFDQDFWLPFNFIGGLITSNDAIDTAHDIAIGPGVARSADDTVNLKLTSILTKQTDGLWVVGDDQPGLDTGAVAVNTLYALWLIKRPDTGVVDAIFSTSFAAPDSTRIPDYTKKRLIGAVRTDGGGNVTGYLQSGDHFEFMTQHVADIDDTSITNGAFETGTLLVPPLCLARVGIEVVATTATPDRCLTRIRTNGSGANAFIADVLLDSASDILTHRVEASVLVDANSQVNYSATITSGNPDSIEVYTNGFTMLTRSNP